jgi:predicted phosphodiesterase
MRILAISDIHNNVACVRKLRSQEANDFDAIAVAGDVGGHRAVEIFDILKTFQCPITYVYGNWDSKLPYGRSFGSDCHLIHLNVVKIGSLAFTGFSDFSRGRDPLLTVAKRLTGTRYVQKYRDALVGLIMRSGLDLRRTIVITHARTTLLGPRLPGLLLYLFGHVHTYEVRESKGSTYANVSALDRILPVVPTRTKTRKKKGEPSLEERKWNPLIGKLRHVNAGNYVIIDINAAGELRIECRLLHHAYKNWKVVREPLWFGAPLVPEEAIFGDNIRFPKER